VYTSSQGLKERPTFLFSPVRHHRRRRYVLPLPAWHLIDIVILTSSPTFCSLSTTLQPPAGGCACGSPPLSGMESPRGESGLKVSPLDETNPTASLDSASCFAAAVSFDPVNSYPWLLSSSSLFFSRYTSHCWLHSFSATLVS
jgi:hypothetical protein